MASAKILQEWCRDTCTGYPEVEIKNMSTSFRNGLAFCAIIHKHRPNLIDFSSLSKDDAYQNNKLAFGVAETNLGIPALLDAEDMVSSEVPDCLSIITYLSQYYYFFNRKLCVASSRWSPHITVLNITKSQKHLQSSTDLETSKEDCFTDTKTQTVCNLCLKPVHLIQRHLIDGKVFHRSCFRCKECHCTLIAGSYTKRSDTGSLICAYHVTKSQTAHPNNPNQQITSACQVTQRRGQTDFYSLSGVAITSVPCYTQKTESPVKLVYTTQTKGSKEVKKRENLLLGLPPPSQPHAKEKTETYAGKNQPVTSVVDRKGQLNETKTSELPSSCSQGDERTAFPVPTPRRSSAVVPVPAPRTKTFQTMSETSSTDASDVTSHKVITNHPWMTIVHPGPWSQLPPAPPPIPFPRSKSVAMVQVSSNRPKKPPRNPFEEEETEDIWGEAVGAESANQSEPSETDNEDTHAAVCSRDAKNPSFQSEQKELFRERSKDAAADQVKDVSVAEDMVAASAYRDSSLVESLDQTETKAELSSTSADTHILPRSLSVPAITSDLSQTYLMPVTLKEISVTSCQSKPACKENPFDRKPGMSKSKTVQDLSSSRGPAPGHGFPLIKRKVQSDLEISLEDLELQMRDLRKQLEALEQRGVQLESKLRDCKKGKEEEQMFAEWISLNHERHILSRKDTELVYLTKQKHLEDRQADVEYGLRCLLNKPDSEWSQEDRDQDQQLMGELVTIIEQRNQIISSLDQDRQRERKEDVLWEDKIKNKDLKKDEYKEIKKSKGRFKPTKVFKILNPKTDNSKD